VPVIPRTIPYTPVNWVDGVTPVNAANLNVMEDMIEALAAAPAPSGGGIEYENAWAAPTAYEAGDVVIHEGVEYLAVNPSTGQEPPAPATQFQTTIPLVTALPTPAFDGQEVDFTDSLTSPTYTWRLRYVAAKATNKWVFVGGSPSQSIVTRGGSPGSAISSPTYAEPATVHQLVVPLAGAYDVEFSATGDCGSPDGSGQMWVGIKIGATLPADDLLSIWSRSENFQTGSRQIRIAIPAPATTLAIVARQASANGRLFMTDLAVLPVAVGG
jgi:hypothetical protein